MRAVAGQTIKHGYPLGKRVICDALKTKALALSKTFWNAQVADEFMEGVDAWRPGKEFSFDWLPVEELATFGYRPNTTNSHWVMTTGVDSHVDNIWGPTLVWVLVNDSMCFKQGREKLLHEPGEWYIFNDALAHAVDVTKASPAEAVYLGWAVQLQNI
jgi:hypothetical protein